jgi:hypothetical protein
VARWTGFNEKTQEYDVESPTGKRSKVAGHKISKDVTPEEEAEFLRQQKRD